MTRPRYPKLAIALARAGVVLVIALGAAARGHAFGRLNVLLSWVPVPGPAVDGVPGPPRSQRLQYGAFAPVAVLGRSLLFADWLQHRILRLEDGVLTVFAGTGQPGIRINPDAPLQTRLGYPMSLLVLRDQSVLVSTRDDNFSDDRVLRIRTRPQAGEATVSVFAGNGTGKRVIDPGSALATGLGRVASMAQERDGSVLLSDATTRRVLRVRPDRTVEVVAGTGVRGQDIHTASGPLTQLDYPRGLAVLEDDSILLADKLANRVLRIRPGAVTVYAGAWSDPEHLIQLDAPIAIAVLPDRSVCLLEHRWHELTIRLLRFRPEGVSLMAGPNLGGVDLDPGYCPGLEAPSYGTAEWLLPLRDGSVVIGPVDRGLLLLSPADALQARLEALVDQGKAAVRAENLPAYRQAERDLAYLCAPGSRALRASNRAAHDLGRLEPSDLEPRLHLIADLVKVVQGYAGLGGAERLRAQLALKELRKFKKDRLGRAPRSLSTSSRGPGWERRRRITCIAAPAWRAG